MSNVWSKYNEVVSMLPVYVTVVNGDATGSSTSIESSLKEYALMNVVLIILLQLDTTNDSCSRNVAHTCPRYIHSRIHTAVIRDETSSRVHPL